jgi:hypothetical protein
MEKTATARTSATRLLSFDVGIIHLAYAELVVSGPSIYKLARWGVMDVTDGAGMPKKNVIDVLSQQLLDTLDREFNDPSIMYDFVLIENQPANKNPLMKSVQMIIYTYFNCLRMYVGNIGAVRLVSATRKLNMLHSVEPPAPTPMLSASEQYRLRKATAVRIATHYLSEVMHDPDMAGVLRSSKKKDDLSDCLLQALWFAEQHLHPSRLFPPPVQPQLCNDHQDHNHKVEHVHVPDSHASL